MNLVELVVKLRACPTGHTYTVAPIRGVHGDNVLIGVDTTGRPSLFIRAVDAYAGPSLQSAQARLELGRHYILHSIESDPMSARFHALHCLAEDDNDRHTFLLLLESLLADEEPLDRGRIGQFFQSLIRLFSIVPTRDWRRERQGLWGELFLMSRCGGYRFWAPFWRSEPTRRFDFSAPGKRVEVKTTVGSERIHMFSHRQLFALEGEDIVIASMVLTEDDAGLPLRSLIEEAKTTLRGTEHIMKLERAVRQAGMQTGDEAGPSYDPVDAEESLRWYWSHDVPHFHEPEPAGVSQTHYRVDLSTIPSIGADDLAAWLATWSDGEAA